MSYYLRKSFDLASVLVCLSGLTVESCPTELVLQDIGFVFEDIITVR